MYHLGVPSRATSSNPLFLTQHPIPNTLLNISDALILFRTVHQVILGVRYVDLRQICIARLLLAQRYTLFTAYISTSTKAFDIPERRMIPSVLLIAVHTDFHNSLGSCQKLIWTHRLWAALIPIYSRDHDHQCLSRRIQQVWEQVLDFYSGNQTTFAD